MSHDSNSTGAVSLVSEPGESSALISAEYWKTQLLRIARQNLSKDMVTTVLCSFFLFGLFVVQGVVLARMLGPEGRGQFATTVFYTQTLAFIGLLGTQQAVARWAARKPMHAASLMRLCGRLGAMTGIGTMLVVSALAMWALPADKQYLAPLCILCALFLPLEHVRQLWLSVDHGLGRFDSYNLNRIVAGIAFPILLIVVWACGLNAVSIVCVCYFSAPLIAIVYRKLTPPAADEFVAGPTCAKLLKRGRSYSLAVIASDLFDRIDVFLFLWLASFAAQGFYAAALPAASLLMVLPLALALFAFNAGADRDHVMGTRRMLKMAAIVFGIQVASAIVYAIVLQPLILLVYGEKFREAIPFAMALLPAYALAGCGRIADSYLQGRNRAIVGVWAKLAGAVVMLGFVFAFFSRWNEMSIPYGAIVGHLVSAVVLLTAILIDLRDSTPSKASWGDSATEGANR